LSRLHFRLFFPLLPIASFTRCYTLDGFGVEVLEGKRSSARRNRIGRVNTATIIQGSSAVSKANSTPPASDGKPARPKKPLPRFRTVPPLRSRG
jgi:hypothetical protein